MSSDNIFSKKFIKKPNILTNFLFKKQVSSAVRNVISIISYFIIILLKFSFLMQDQCQVFQTGVTRTPLIRRMALKDKF